MVEVVEDVASYSFLLSEPALLFPASRLFPGAERGRLFCSLLPGRAVQEHKACGPIRRSRTHPGGSAHPRCPNDSPSVVGGRG